MFTAKFLNSTPESSDRKYVDHAVTGIVQMGQYGGNTAEKIKDVGVATRETVFIVEEI